MKSLFSILLLSLSFIASAQGNFKPGYIVLNSGDTVKGEVEYASWAVNPESITFRNAGSSQKYDVSQLKAFGVGDETLFNRFRISYQLSAADLAEATETFEGPVKTADTWLRLLYKAKYSLYELSTSKRKFFFIESGNDGIKELIYRVRLSSGGVMEKDEQYKNLLTSYALQEDQLTAVQKQLGITNYDDKDLLKIFSLINGGKSSFKESAHMKTKFDVSAGGTFYSFSTSGNIFNDGSGAYAVHTANFKSSVGFVAGFGLTYYSKRNRGRLQSRLGLNVASLSLDGTNTSGAGSFQREKYDGSLLMLEPNISLDLLLSKEKQPAFLLGVVFGYNIVIKNNFSSTFENPGVVVTRDNFPPVNGGFITAGLNATAQGDWGRLNLRGYILTNIFDSPLTTLKGTGISLTYGYYLKK